MRMKQIKVGWNQRIDVLRSYCERLDLLFDEQANIVLKAIGVNIVLKGPEKFMEKARNSPTQMKIELPMFKAKRAQDFDELSDMFEENIKH